MNVARILSGISGLSALVVGDICLDRWCTYAPSTSDPSRETGIPRIGIVSTEVTPGAGGTVANNLAALGAGRVAALGVVADDGCGYELRRALEERDIDPSRLVDAPGLQTFTYTKVINGDTGIEDCPRLDFINTQPLAPAVEQQLVDRLRESAPEFDVILVSDQAETSQGEVVTALMREAISEIAASFPDKVIWVDSRLRPELFRGVTVKPNNHEAEAACARLGITGGFQQLRRHIAAPILPVTFGPKGVLVVSDSGETWVTTRPVEKPVDICGAGDSFSAGCALALRLTRDPITAAQFGNLVASITIMKKGTGTASPEEVLAAEDAIPA